MEQQKCPYLAGKEVHIIVSCISKPYRYTTGFLHGLIAFAIRKDLMCQRPTNLSKSTTPGTNAGLKQNITAQ